MRRSAIPAAVAVAAAALLYIGYRTFFPSDEQLIRRRLDELAAAVNTPADGLDAVTRAAAIGRALADDVEIRTRQGTAIRGKDTVMGIAARLEPRSAGLNLKFQDVTVTLDDERHAHVELTATYADPESDGHTLDAAEFTLQMVKPAREWLVARVAPVQVLQR
jgi:hypothetical protein